jgi:ERCC4-related helicase
MPVFRVGDAVIDIRTDEAAVVRDVDESVAGVLYLVEFPSGRRYVPEARLAPARRDPLDLLRSDASGDVNAFHRRLQGLLLQHAYQFDPYSGLNSARVEPMPYQVGVAARVLDKVRPRMLLADEVGLGKTIEAGLVIKELLAREIAERVLVLCPAGLLTQWKYELESKFNEEFTILDANALRFYSQQGFTNPFLGTSKALCSTHLARRKERAAQIIEADWHLVVVDEAHHLAPRPDPNLLYRLVEQLSDQTYGLLLLTATPIQLRARELFDLLELVEPGTFQSEFDFEAKRHLIPKLNRLWKQLKDWPILSSQERRDLFLYQPGRMRELGLTSEGQCDDKSIRDAACERLELEHPYVNAMVRNRKDVIEVGVRREASVIACPQSPLEAEIYQEVAAYLRDEYDAAIQQKHRTRGLLMVTYLKMLSSSSAALADSFRNRINKLTNLMQGRKHTRMDLEELADKDLDDFVDTLNAEAAAVVEEVQTLRRLVGRLDQVEDTKLLHLLERLARIFAEHPDQKVLIFTQFLGTQRLLEQRIGERYKVAIFNGRMSKDDKDRATRQFRTEAPVMVATEAGGEGRNFQFCHMLTNYDLPWNPMRVEQRIGRLDRIGQSHIVRVENLVAVGTIEERVEGVLRRRINVFEESIGGLDPILGPQLERDFEHAALGHGADLDRRFEGIEHDLEQRRFHAAEMEEQLDDFIMDQQSFRRDQAAVILHKRNGTLLPDLRALVAAQVKAMKDGSLVPHSEGGEVLTLPHLLSRKAKWRYRGTFDPREAAELEEIDFFAFGHPAIDRILNAAMEPSDQRLFASYQCVDDEEFAGIELVCRITTEGLRRNAHIRAVRVDEHGHGSVRHLSRWTVRSSKLVPDQLPFDRQPDRLEVAIKQATALLAEHTSDVVHQDQKAARRWHRREVERENRIYEKRLAAAQVELASAYAVWESKNQSADLGDQQILPALLGKADKAAQRIQSIEEAHRAAIHELQEQLELLPAFEILAASLIRVTSRTRNSAKRPHRR